MNSPGAAHDTRLHVVSKEVESTIEYVCKVGACMETHDQVGVRKQLKRPRFSNKNCTGFKGEETSSTIANYSTSVTGTSS